MELNWDILKSPVGEIFMGVDGNGGLVRMSFLSAYSLAQIRTDLEGLGYQMEQNPDPLDVVKEQLNAYFERRLEVFDLPMVLHGTSFQKAVWHELTKIPFGTCKSYGEIADALGTPGASRAVGTANNRNPIPIVVPCHRVIGANGRLVGFGGGVDVKSKLLKHEGYFMI